MWEALMPALASIAGGAIGSSESAGARSDQRRALMEALAQFQNIDVPTLQEQELQLSGPQYTGDYSSLLENLSTLGPSQMEQITSDPRLKNAQMSALDTLSEMGEGGLTEGEMAAMRELRRQSAAEAQAKQGQILQEMSQRGTLGGGMELASRMGAAQSGANRLSSEGDRLAQMAQERALQAISQKGNLAGNIRGQEFGEQSQMAQAADAISRFNAQNQQSVESRNVSASNQARLRNLQEKQRIAEQQNAIQNYQQEKNKALIPQQFQQQMQLAGAKSGQYGQQAQLSGQQAANTANMWAGIGSGVGGGIAAFNKKDTKET